MKPKLYWITGASTGIGATLARHLAYEGHKVAISARSVDKLEQLALQDYGAGKIVTYPVDVTDNEAVIAVVKQIRTEQGPIDAAIFSAGTYITDNADKLDVDGFAQQFDLNVMGVIRSLAAVVPTMRKHQDAQIAIIASVAGYRGLPHASGYGATKAALINLAESLRPEYDLMGIKLQVICPGFVKTPLTDKNKFPMPFLISAEKAAQIIARGLRSRRFEIVFPWQMALSMKLLKLMPYALFFPLIKAGIKRAGK